MGLGSSHYKGLMDEIRIYNRALSEEEVQKLHQAQKKGRRPE